LIELRLNKKLKLITLKMSSANLFFLIIFGYFLGSIPWGYLISKAKRIDIQKVGSGSIGGTNVLRALGLKWAALVGILDIAKGVIPTYLAITFLVSSWQIALVAVSPILGHILPVWLKFKGGKGIATTFGVLFVLLGWKFFLIFLLIWLPVLAISRIMSFTNLLMASFFPLILWLASLSLAYFILGIILTILIWWAHRENLQRIKEEREPKFKLKRQPAKFNEQFC
jgi:glycerol-3-phosphate acyltransferase PlsY